MHTCVCFCTLALTFPLFQCLSVALSAPNTASLLSTASLSDSRYHQEWPFPPTSLFFSLPLSFYFFRSEVVVSSVVQSRSVGRVQAVALLSQEHCFLFTLHLDYAAILRRTFSSTKCVSSMKRGFYVALVTFIELIFFLQMCGCQASQLSHSNWAFAVIIDVDLAPTQEHGQDIQLQTFQVSNALENKEACVIVLMIIIHMFVACFSECWCLVWPRIRVSVIACNSNL